MGKIDLTKVFDYAVDNLPKKSPNVYEKFAEADDTLYKSLSKNVGTAIKRHYKDLTG